MGHGISFLDQYDTNEMELLQTWQCLRYGVYHYPCHLGRDKLYFIQRCFIA